MAETSDELLGRVLRSAASLSQPQAARLAEEVRQQVESEVREWLHCVWKAALLKQLADELEQAPADVAAAAHRPSARDTAGRARPATRDDPRDASAGAHGQGEPGAAAPNRPSKLARRGEPPAAGSPADPPDSAERTASPTATGPAPDAADEPLGQYAYGIVLADHPPLPSNLAGVDPGFAVEMIGHDGLQVITSGVPLRDFSAEGWAERVSDLQWVEARLRAHDQVLKTALAHGPLIPLRFGTIFRSSDELVRLLPAERDRLIETLHRLSGKAEWGVKVVHDGDRGGRPADRRQPAAAGPARTDGFGRAYLQQRQRERQQRQAGREQRAMVVRQCHEVLAAAACEAVALPAAPSAARHCRDDDVVFNGSYLLDHSQLEPFRELVTRLADRHGSSGLRFETTGPWPPYHFVGFDLFLDRPDERSATDAPR